MGQLKHINNSTPQRFSNVELFSHNSLAHINMTNMVIIAQVLQILANFRFFFFIIWFPATLIPIKYLTTYLEYLTSLMEHLTTKSLTCAGGPISEQFTRNLWDSNERSQIPLEETLNAPTHRPPALGSVDLHITL